MRDYAKVGPAFWEGKIGRSLRGDAITIAVANYLMTCPASNMIGLYRLPLGYMAADLGYPESPFEAPSKPLRSPFLRGAETTGQALCKLCELGFLAVDLERELVWVVKAIKHEFPKPLNERDNQVKAIRWLVREFDDSPLYDGFLRTYGEYLGLSDLLAELPEVSPFEAPSKPLRSPFEAPSKPGSGSGALAGSGNGAGTGEEPAAPDPLREPKQARLPPAKPARPGPPQEQSEFAELCKIYPAGKLGNRARCAELFRVATCPPRTAAEAKRGLPPPVEPAAILKGAEAWRDNAWRYFTAEDWKYQVNLERWLTERRWEDAPEKRAGKAPPAGWSAPVEVSQRDKDNRLAGQKRIREELAASVDREEAARELAEILRGTP